MSDSRAVVARNTSYLIASRTLVLGIGFAFNVLLARHFLVEGFGDYTFAISYLAIFSVLVRFGMRPLMIREVSIDRERAGQYLGNALTLTGLLFVITVAAVVAVTVWLDYPPAIRQLIFVLTGWLLLNGIMLATNAIFSAFERMEYPAAIAVMEKAVFVTWGLVAITTGRGILAVGVGFVAASAAAALASLFLINARFVKARLRFDRQFCASLLRRSAPFFSIAVLSELYAEIDTTMVYSMQGAAAAGLYAAAFRLGRFPSYISSSFHQSLYPVLAQRARMSVDHVSRALHGSLHALAVVAIPVGVTLTVLADRLLILTFGETFADAAPALKVLAWVTVIQFVTPLFTRTLFALNRQTTDAGIQGVGLATTVLLNMILIPRYSFVGAACGSLAATALMLSIYGWRTSRLLGRVSIVGAFARPVVAGVPMLAAMYALQASGILAVLVAGSASYLIALWLVGGLARDGFRST